MLPESVSEWLTLDGVEEQSIMVGGVPVSCGIFNPASKTNVETVNIFVGGIPRDNQRWPVLPVINKFFGYVAAGLASEQSVGISFNWPGLGNTPGDISRTSIDTRTDFLVDLSHTMLSTFDADKVSFASASMGAYCAALASEKLPTESVRKQAFLSLPAYPASAHSLVYADGFGAEIRRDWSLEESPIYQLLADTAIPSLIGYSEYDDPTIPQSIQDGFLGTVLKNDRLTHHIIKGVYHNFRRSPGDLPGEAVDNEAVRQFGDTLIAFLSE
jgi:hypothetical protein